MRQSAGRNVLAAWYEHRSSFVKRLSQCAQIVLNSTSLQLIPAYSSQSSEFSQTLVGVGLSEAE
jgi:hypothetical protein